jgi:hypothetical protein
VRPPSIILLLGTLARSPGLLLHLPEAVCVVGRSYTPVDLQTASTAVGGPILEAVVDSN